MERYPDGVRPPNSVLWIGPNGVREWISQEQAMQNRATNIGNKIQQRYAIENAKARAVENVKARMRVHIYENAAQQAQAQVLLQIGIGGSMVTGMAGAQVGNLAGIAVAGSGTSGVVGGGTAVARGVRVATGADRVRVVTTEALEAAKAGEEAAAYAEELEQARALEQSLLQAVPRVLGQ